MGVLIRDPEDRSIEESPCCQLQVEPSGATSVRCPTHGVWIRDDHAKWTFTRPIP